MLQLIREKAQGVIAWSIVGLIAIVFAFLGFDNFFSGRSNSGVAAKVNGDKIYWQTIDNIYQKVYQQYALQPDFDPDNIDPVLAKNQIRNALVQQTVLLNSVLANGYRVGNEELKYVLQNIPAFKKDGRFSPDLYYRTLQNSGLSESAYQNKLKKEILLTKFQQAIGSSSFSTEKEKLQIISLLNQKRDFGYVILPKDNFKNEVKLTDEDLKAFYNKNKKSFIEPAKIQVAFVELNLEDLINKIDVDESQLQDYYNENVNRYITPALVKVSHILISTPKGANSEQNKTAKAKIDAVLAKLNAKSQSFEELAEEFSEDSSSAVNGGDLGWISKGDVDLNFAKQAFALDKNQISGIIQTNFGYHILKVIDKQPKSTKTFAEVKSDVANTYKREQAELLLADKSEELSNLAFENSDSLTEISERLGLVIKTSDEFSKEGASVGIGSIKKVIDVAFSEDVVALGKNSDVIKINDESFVVLRLNKHFPERQLDFDIVKSRVETKLLAENLQNIAKNKGKQLFTAIKSGNNPVDATKKYNLEWKSLTNIARGYDKLDSAIIQSVFGLPSPKLNEHNNKETAAAGIALANGDYAVVVLNDVHIGRLETENLAQSYAKHVAITLGRYEYNLYQDSVLNNAKIKLNNLPTR